MYIITINAIIQIKNHNAQSISHFLPISAKDYRLKRFVEWETFMVPTVRLLCKHIPSVCWLSLDDLRSVKPDGTDFP